MSLLYMVIFYILLAFSITLPFEKISASNRLLKEAEMDYKEGNYGKALLKYKYLLQKSNYQHVHLKLNLAHCYFFTGNYKEAKTYYQFIENSKNYKLQSIAFQQLGIIAYQNKQAKESLKYFKKALIANPFNEKARYNYELVIKQLATNSNLENKKTKQPKTPEENKQPENLPPPPEESEDKNNGNKEPPQEEENQSATKEKTVKERLQKINMSEEKAKMLLDAMKNNEMQYIQQRKRKASQKNENDLPDW